jgi:hypothetical protein
MARLIEAHAAALVGQGRGETIARWVEELPAEVQAKRPWTLYWAAASQAQLTPREGRILYEKAFEQFRAGGDGLGMLLAASGAMFAVLYELDDCSLLDRWIAVVDGAEKSGTQAPSREVEARVACGMFISLTLRQPQRRDIKHWIERALARRAMDVNLRLFVASRVAHAHVDRPLHARRGADRGDAPDRRRERRVAVLAHHPQEHRGDVRDAHRRRRRVRKSDARRPRHRAGDRRADLDLPALRLRLRRRARRG